MREKLVKRIMLVLGILVLGVLAAGQLKADDNPYLGTWKLNVAKSKAENTTVPKSMTRTVTMAGAMVKYSFEGVAADGTPTSYSFTVAYDGKDYPVTGTGMPGDADTISIKRTGNKATAVLKKAGKEVGTSTSEVSADGKTTTLKASGKTPDGKMVSSVSVYEKQ
jgi:hypothetical protein